AADRRDVVAQRDYFAGVLDPEERCTHPGFSLLYQTVLYKAVRDISPSRSPRCHPEITRGYLGTPWQWPGWSPVNFPAESREAREWRISRRALAQAGHQQARSGPGWST